MTDYWDEAEQHISEIVGFRVDGVWPNLWKVYNDGKRRRRANPDEVVIFEVAVANLVDSLAHNARCPLKQCSARAARCRNPL